MLRSGWRSNVPRAISLSAESAASRCHPHANVDSARSVIAPRPEYAAIRIAFDGICGWMKIGCFNAAAVADRLIVTAVVRAVSRRFARRPSLRHTRRPAARSSSAATAFGAAIGKVDKARSRVGYLRTASAAMSFASRLSATASAGASGPVPGGARPRICTSMPCSSMLAMRPMPMSSSLVSLSPSSLNIRLSSRW